MLDKRWNYDPDCDEEDEINDDDDADCICD